MSTPRKTTKRSTSSDPVKRRVSALRAFAESDHYEEVMKMLKEHSWWGVSPFVAADWNPHKAAGIETRQGLVHILEDEVRKAQNYTEQ